MSRKTKIAAGAVAAGGSGAIDAAPRYTSRDIEAAMSAAITKAHADGITDPADVRVLMQAARRAVVSGE